MIRDLRRREQAAERPRAHALLVALFAWSLIAACRTVATTLPISTADSVVPANGPREAAVDPTTLDRKLMFGYPVAERLVPAPGA